MGAGYSAPTLKTQLKMAAQRLMMHRNKKTNQASVDSKAVAILLQQGKDESARIRCEAIIHEKNLTTAMELLTLMCELITARVQLITASKVCPVDLEEGVASIIYCASRVEIPELKTCAEQFGARWTKEWAMRHANNESGKVNPRIIEKLSIQPPPFEVVLNLLHEIAATYQVDWQPDMAALESGIVDHSNPERLGSIARIPVAQPGAQLSDGPQPIATPSQQQSYPSMLSNPPVSSSSSSQGYPSMLMPNPPRQQQSAASPSSSAPPPHTAANPYPIADPHLSAPAIDNPGGMSMFPGTLNIVIHRGRNILNLASQSEPHDLYVRLTNLTTGVTWKSDSDAHGGSNPVWHGNPNLPPSSVHHFPFSVNDPTSQIQVEIFQRNKGTFGLKEDKLLGQASFYADNLRANPQLQWYGLYLQNMQTGFLLMQTQYIPLNANILSKAELDQQQSWLQQEKEQRENQSPLFPAGDIPGGPSQQYPASYAAAAASGGDGGNTTAVEPGYASSNAAAPTATQAKIPSRNSFSDRVVGLFKEPPPSPPHDHSKNLSDLVKQPSNAHHPAVHDSTYAASRSVGQPLPDASYQALPSGSGQEGASAAAEEKQDDPVLDFPDVPKHSAGAGRNGKDGSGPRNPYGSAGGGSAGGSGGTLYAQRPPPAAKKSATSNEDEDLEARFKRLGQ